MATWECGECTAVYSVGAPKCPECGSKVRVNDATQPPEEDNEMTPKITVHGGPSVDGFDVDPESGELTPVDEGGEDVSASSSSSTSSSEEQSSPETSEPPSPSRARKTASRSAKDRTGTPDSTAATADGGPAAGGSETGSKS
ncbi:hypothetical protein ACFU96_21765 [Streptomyces sp. NPDC057620]|uniref:hypothetical protein n=1 Tax=Streptomyces sp. NPDC057620 TaxID=3346185 RepID=UPI00367AD6D7